MKIQEYKKLKSIILSYIDDVPSMIENIKAHGQGIQGWIQAGALACYYSTCDEELREVYGDDFKESVYYTKDGDYRWKNGEAYIWTVYKWKMGQAIEKLIKEWENENRLSK